MSFRRGLTVLAVVSMLPTGARALDLSVEDSAKLLTERHLRANQQSAKQAVLDLAKADAGFRERLVTLLIGRLKEKTEPHQGDGEIRALGELKATQALSVLLERWRAMPKKTYALDFADPRTQLVKALVGLQSGPEGIQFLIKTVDDEDEAPAIRLEAHVLLCATADPAGIHHVTLMYEQDGKRFSREMPGRGDKNELSKPSAWDQDGDWMSDYAERGLLLDPSKPDTDGDGLADGQDRNPLTAPKGEPTDRQRIAQQLFWLYAKYLSPAAAWDYAGTGPIGCNVRIVLTTNEGWNSSDTASLFGGIELLGADGIVLAMNAEQNKRYSDLHGPNRTPRLSIGCYNDLEQAEVREAIMKNMNVEPGTLVFHLSEHTVDGGVRGGKLIGNMRSWEIHVKKIGDVWLPVLWRLGAIT